MPHHPQRGSSIEINVTKKEERSGADRPIQQIPGELTLLRGMDPMYSATANIIREFTEPEVVKLNRRMPGPSSLATWRTPSHHGRRRGKKPFQSQTGEVYVDSGKPFTNDKVDKILASMLKEVNALTSKDPY